MSSTVVGGEHSPLEFVSTNVESYSYVDPTELSPLTPSLECSE